jgi:hypothetical protein
MSAIRRERLAVAIGAVLLVAGIAATAQGSPAPGPRQAPNLAADLSAGKAHRLPESPANWVYSSVWRNCQFVVVKMHDTHYTDGDVEVAVMDSSPAEIDAQLPPEDPACTGVTPTADQIASDRVQLYALGESARPKSPHPGPEGGNPGPPPTLPLHP